MSLKTFDPKQTVMIVGTKIISGFADGSYIKLIRNEPMFALKVGVDGEGTRAKSNNKSGRYEITLNQSSRSNDDLSAYAAADELDNSGAVPVLLKDGSGRMIASSLTGWVQKYPDVELAKESTMRTWIIESDEILIFIGGN